MLLFSQSSMAEYIDGPANIRDEPNGKVIYQLNDYEQVFPKPYKDGWYKMELTACVKPADYDMETYTIKAGTTIYQCDGDIMGQTYVDIEADTQGCDPEGEDYCLVMIVDGVTYKSNIRGGMLLEESLMGLLNNGVHTRQGLKEHMDTYVYESIGVVGSSLNIYFSRGSHVFDPSPTPRLMLVFHEDSLVAVVWASNDLLQLEGHLVPNSYFMIKHYSDDKALTDQAEKDIAWISHHAD